MKKKLVQIDARKLRAELDFSLGAWVWCKTKITEWLVESTCNVDQVLE
jgi:hypothetical protein